MDNYRYLFTIGSDCSENEASASVAFCRSSSIHNKCLTVFQLSQTSTTSKLVGFYIIIMIVYAMTFCRCPSYGQLPPGCVMKKPPGECCGVPDCSGLTGGTGTGTGTGGTGTATGTGTGGTGTGTGTGGTGTGGTATGTGTGSTGTQTGT